MCDILGVDSEGNTWFKIYISLLNNATNVDFVDRDASTKSISFLEGNANIVYSQIRFKNS